jgi:GNAT superfamily N-acetyltransferase
MGSEDTDSVSIRPLQASDSLEELTDLLHRAYKALADMGLRYVATYQSVDITHKRILYGTCFVAVVKGRIVGTITYHPSSHTRGSPWYEREGVAKITQISVEPELQGNGLGRELVAHVEEYARQDGAVEVALDTAEPAHHLIDWYRRMGYRFVEYVDWPVTNYRSMVFSKKL